MTFSEALAKDSSEFDLESFFQFELNEHENVISQSKLALCQPFEELVETCVKALVAGNKLLFFGNGGSAADSQHLATELCIKYSKERPAIAAIALTTDTSALTAAGNDFGFEYIFSRQIEALGKPGDVAIGITTSGNSQNVIKALSVAKSLELQTVAFTGCNGGLVKDVADLSLIVPSSTTARIQEVHILIGQMLCAAIEQSLRLV